MLQRRFPDLETHEESRARRAAARAAAALSPAALSPAKTSELGPAPEMPDVDTLREATAAEIRRDIERSRNEVIEAARVKIGNRIADLRSYLAQATQKEAERKALLERRGEQRLKEIEAEIEDNLFQLGRHPATTNTTSEKYLLRIACLETERKYDARIVEVSEAHDGMAFLARTAKLEAEIEALEAAAANPLAPATKKKAKGTQ